MKRDMSLVRELLFFFESDSTLPAPTADEDTITGHLVIMIEAGLLHGDVNETSSGVGAYIDRLTWEGHEFLAVARDDTIWNKVQNAIKSKVGEISYPLLKSMLVTAYAAALNHTHHH